MSSAICAASAVIRTEGGVAACLDEPHHGMLDRAVLGLSPGEELPVGRPGPGRCRVERGGPRYGTRKTETETRLRAALAGRAQALPDGVLRPTSTVRDAAEFWRRHLADAALSTSTVRLYLHALDRHVLGLVGAANLADVELRNVRVSNLEPALRVVAVGSDAGMTKTTRSVYRAILSLAVRHDAIPHNPVSDLGTIAVRPLVRETERDTGRAFTRAERDRVIAHADTDERAVSRDVGDLLAFLAGTGVRIGEACAVRWDDLDLDAALATVGEFTVVRVKGAGLVRVAHGKTKTSTRRLVLPSWLVDRLKARRTSATFAENETGVVFASPLGRLRDPSNTAHHVRDVLDGVESDPDRAGECQPLSWATAHTFRKTAITLLHDSGLSDREVANFSGHKRIGVMQDHYLSRYGVSGAAADVL
jgi:integrase